MTLKQFQDDLARDAYGWTAGEAHAAGVCIDCRRPPVLRDAKEAREYQITALCGPCWDEMFPPDDEPSDADDARRVFL